MDSNLSIAQGLDILSDLLAFIPTHLQAEAQMIAIKSSEPDTVIFTSSKNGSFSIADYIAQTRPCEVDRKWAKWIWNKFLPANISAFLWRLARHALPVDSRIQTRGILIASRCHCCHNHEVESLSHLFISFEVACGLEMLWGMFRLPYHFPSTTQAMRLDVHRELLLPIWPKLTGGGGICIL